MTNVLLITADQWRADCLGAAGHPVVRTPNIDRLAAEGVRFARHFGQAAPCSPARACLYTGLYQMTNRVVRNGTPLDQRHVTLAQTARALGYDPTLFGYTDMGVDPRTTVPADPWLTTYEGILPGMTSRVHLPEYPGPWLSWLAQHGVAIPARWQEVYLPADGAPVLHGKPPRFGTDQTQAAYLTGEFGRWLGEQRRPWFAHVSFLSPHPPFVVPEPWATMYSPEQGDGLVRSGTWEDEAARHPYLNHVMRVQRKHAQVYGPPGPVTDGSEAEARQIRATYWGMVSEIDHRIGQIRAMIEARGEWEDTIFVLTSDHGEQLGDHHLWGKLGFYDQSYQVPLIIRAPGAVAGRVVEGFSESIDLFPTLIDLLGAPVPDHLDGRSLKAEVLEVSPTSAASSEAHFEYDFRDIEKGVTQSRLGLGLDQCSLAVIRDERFKYVHFTAMPPLLFDLTEDPGETVNLAEDPAYLRVRIDYAERLLSWRAEHLDRRLTGLALGPRGVMNWR